MQVFKKSLFLSVNIFAMLLLIDFIFTLFSINESGVFKSVLGIVFDMKYTETEISTGFGVEPKMFIYFLLCFLIVLGINLIVSKKK